MHDLTTKHSKLQQIAHHRITRGLAAVTLATAVLLTGCETKEQKAIDQAKQQAAATNTPQQVSYVDSKGDTVTTVVAPPATAGQPPAITTTTTPPPAGAPVPHATQPVVTPANASMSPTGIAENPSGAPVQAPAPVSFTIPAGTQLAMRIDQRISVKQAHAGDTFSGEIVEPVSINGSLIVPKGTPVRGVIDEAHKRGHFKGASVLEMRLTSMTLNGNDYPLDTRDNVERKKGKGRRTAGFIGGMTGAGMLIGGLATGGVGLAIGGAAGAGAGTLLAGTTGNRDIVIPAESVIHFRLADSVTVQ